MSYQSVRLMGACSLLAWSLCACPWTIATRHATLSPLPTRYPTEALTMPFDGNLPQGARLAVDVVSHVPVGFEKREMAFLRLAASCEGCPVEHPPLALMEVTSVDKLGVFDLAGPEFFFNHQDYDAYNTLSGHSLEEMIFPVALVQLTKHPGRKYDRREEIFLVALPTRADPQRFEIIWRHMLSLSRPDGSGFSTVNVLIFDREDGAPPQDPLSIVLSSTSTGGGRPGPPMEERFVYDGAKFERHTE